MADSELKFTNVSRVLKEYGQAVADLYKDRLADKDVNASNALTNSVRYIVRKQGRNFDVSISLLDYWKYIEYGRKPGKFPPPDVIREWVKVKPVVPRPIDGITPTNNQLAYLIGRKIAREGIAPRPILKESIQHVNAYYEQSIEQALLEDLSDTMTAIIIEAFGD